MAKTKISEYSATANSNTDIGGINVDEGCAPSGINDAIRTLMAQLKNFQTGTGGDSFNGPVGATTPSTGAFTSITASGDITINNGSADGGQLLLASSGYSNWGVDNYSGNFRWYYNTTEKMRLDNAGNLGLGVSPSAWASTFKPIQLGAGGSFITGRTGTTSQIQLGANAYYDGTDWRYINANNASRYYQSAGVHYWETAPVWSGTGSSVISFTQAMTLDASGNLFLGATSAGFAEKFRVYGNYSVFDNGTFTGFIGSGSSLGTGTGSDFAIRSSNAIAFLSGGATERARIDTSGNLLVGTTTQTGTFNVTYTGTAQPVSYSYASNASFSNAVIRAAMAGTSSSAQLFLGQNSNTSAVFYVQGNGTINSTSTSITGISDIRFKENIRDLDDGLNVVMALKPRKFDWKEGKGANIKNARGFIAQEFEQVLPDLIGEWLEKAPEGEDPYKSVRPDLIPTLVKAIQEQQAIIESLKARLDAANL